MFSNTMNYDEYNFSNDEKFALKFYQNNFYNINNKLYIQLVNFLVNAIQGNDKAKIKNTLKLIKKTILEKRFFIIKNVKNKSENYQLFINFIKSLEDKMYNDINIEATECCKGLQNINQCIEQYKNLNKNNIDNVETISNNVIQNINNQNEAMAAVA